MLRISAIFLALFAIAGVAHPGAPAAKLREAFERASEVVLFHTPESRLAGLQYSKQVVRAHAAFIDTTFCRRCELAPFIDVAETLCRDCELGGRDLLKALSRGLAFRGNCPAPLTTVIELHQAEHVNIATVYFSSDARCFEFEGRSYAQTSRALARKLTALSEALQ